MSTLNPAQAFSLPQISTRVWLLVTVVTLAIAALVSLKLGVKTIDWISIWQSFNAYDANNAEHVIVQQMRLPRLLAALIVGAALAVAGVLMQTISRNPLADPGIVGVNAGAAVAVVISVLLLGSSSPQIFIWPALLCSGIATTIVFLLSGSGQAGASPARLVLAGAAVSALLFALVRAVLLVSQQSLDVYRQWVTGSLELASADSFQALLPFFIAAFVMVLICSRLIDALAMGDDIARGLGVKVRLAKSLCIATVTLLCAASVALAGPIGFIGLVIPHAARLLNDQSNNQGHAQSANHGGRLILIAALLGAGLLLMADVVGRLLLTGSEIPAGLMVALIGGVSFIILVRKKDMVRL